MEDKEKNTEVTIACSLDSPELVKRKEEFQKHIFSQAKEVIEKEDSMGFVFNTAKDFSFQLIELINLERDCCPFFRFKIDFMPHQGPITLEIGGTEKAKKMLKFLIDE